MGYSSIINCEVCGMRHKWFHDCYVPAIQRQDRLEEESEYDYEDSCNPSYGERLEDGFSYMEG